MTTAAIIQLVIMAIAVLGTLGYIGRNFAYARTWDQLARDRGLRVYDLGQRPGERRMVGTWNGLKVTIEAERRASRKRQENYFGLEDRRDALYTILQVALPIPAPSGFELRPQTLLASVGKLAGGQDIEIGDPQFDDKFIIRGDDPDAVRDFLMQPGVRAVFASIFKKYPDLSVTRQGFELIRLGVLPAVGITFHLDTLTGRANQLRPRTLDREEPPPALDAW